MARKIRCNDEVVVLSGKDKGKRGRVRCILSSRNKAIVSGINIVKKHRKPAPSANSSGGIFEQESAIDISNLAIFNSSLCKADRIGFKIDETGKKVRIFKSTGKVLEN